MSHSALNFSLPALISFSLFYSLNRFNFSHYERDIIWMSRLVMLELACPIVLIAETSIAVKRGFLNGESYKEIKKNKSKRWNKMKN